MKKQYKINIENISKLYDAARKEALIAVEGMAREILTKHSNLDEFVMAMGTCFFTEKKTGQIKYDIPLYTKDLMTFIDKWDEYLKITGEPMRFTAAGKKITNW
jgi:hypothetical protein